MLIAKYTEVLSNLMDNEQTKPLIDKALSSYPIYEPTNEFVYTHIPTREELNKKILNYYKYREIGFETVGRFLEELDITMNEIMPYYNQLFKSIDVMNGIDDIFGNVDITESFEQDTTGSSESTANTKSDTEVNSNSNTNMKTNSKDVKSNTPQSNLGIPTDEIHVVAYADEMNWNENISNSTGENKDTSSASAESSSTGSATNKTTHTLNKKGNQGVNTYAHDMLEFRGLLRNIEQEIIHDKRLAELFMQVF